MPATQQIKHYSSVLKLKDHGNRDHYRINVYVDIECDSHGADASWGVRFAGYPLPRPHGKPLTMLASGLSYCGAKEFAEIASKWISKECSEMFQSIADEFGKTHD